MTKAFQYIVNKSFESSAYVAITQSGKLLVFSGKENAEDIVVDLKLSEVGFENHEFEVLLIENEQITNIMKSDDYFQ